MTHGGNDPSRFWRAHPGQQTRFLASSAFEALTGGQAGGGKALAIDTPIRTTQGWKTMETICVGDLVFGDDGLPYPVLYVSPLMYDHSVYAVCFDDGNSIVADADHKWLTSSYASRQSKIRRLKRKPPQNPNLARSQQRAEDQTLSTIEILDTLKTATKTRRTNHAIGVCKPLALDIQDLPIDPYVLGAWLGDGNNYGQGFTCAEYELLENISDCGYEISKWDGQYAYGIKGIHVYLRQLRLLKNKHIPPIYLQASIEQRMALLQGLMDTDGCCDMDGGAEFMTTYHPLATDVLELCLSLGIKTRIKTKRATLNGKDYGEAYRIKFTTDKSVFRLSRKAARQKTVLRGTQAVRYIVDVQSTQSVPVRCIAVDSPNHLYLAGRALIATHNTDMLLMEALRQIHHPRYTARLFRRLYPSLEGANGMIARSHLWYPGFGATYNGSKHRWDFPSGAKIFFSGMQYEDDKYQYQGDEICYLAFDELTEFSESQYKFMLTRVRAPVSGLRAYVRAATNPGQVGHAWVKRRFITRDIINKPRWFATIDNVDMEVDKNAENALSRAFYPAALVDNPSADPDYAARIMATGDPILIARLLYGDWDADYIEGRIFDNWSLENIDAAAVYNPEWPVYMGADDGYVEGEGVGTASYHPRVVLFLQDNPSGGVNVIDEYVQTGATYDQTLDDILKNKPYRAPDLAWVDGSAAMFRAEFQKRGIMTANGTHKVTEGIKNVRRLICDGNGVKMLRVHPSCTNLIYEMTTYRSDPKATRAEGGELLPLKMNDHSIDALRYATFHKRWE